jgi:hypothetical protein
VKRITSSIILLLFFSLAYSQTLEDVQKSIKESLALIASKDFTKAQELLSTLTILPDDKVKSISRLLESTRSENESLFGNFIEFRLISVESDENCSRLVALECYKGNGVIWVFHIYNNGDKWGLVSFNCEKITKYYDLVKLGKMKSKAANKIEIP